MVLHLLTDPVPGRTTGGETSGKQALGLADSDHTVSSEQGGGYQCFLTQRFQIGKGQFLFLGHSFLSLQPASRAGATVAESDIVLNRYGVSIAERLQGA